MLSTRAIPDEGVAVRPEVGAGSAQSDWLDRALAWRDALVSKPAFQRWAATFPLTRLVARRRARDLFDLCAGFTYTQTLTSCVRIGLFDLLAERPRSCAEIAEATGLTASATERLLRAAEALRLVEPRTRDRFGNGALGAPLVGNVPLLQMIEHNALLYEELRDPVSVLTRPTTVVAGLARHYPYSHAARPNVAEWDEVAGYSALMANTIEPVAQQLFDTYSLAGRSCLLDVGGGAGVMLQMAARRYPALRLRLFDLSAVVAEAEKRLEWSEASERVEYYGGDFHQDPLPRGADVVTLIRVLLDHGDDAVMRLLRQVRAALDPGGVVLITEPMSGVPGVEMVSDVYFGWYLRAMGEGRTRRPEELRQMLQSAGFARSYVARTRYPVFAGLIVGEA